MIVAIGAAYVVDCGDGVARQLVSPVKKPEAEAEIEYSRLSSDQLLRARLERTAR